MCLQIEHDALSGLGRDELSRKKSSWVYANKLTLKI